MPKHSAELAGAARTTTEVNDCVVKCRTLSRMQKHFLPGSYSARTVGVSSFTLGY
jgi:hypothetical protein